ncbi:MAG TPA: type 1 glutamine amidotransferase [Candidatus Methylacidiphilales bacterium]|jgi:GMP synthase (glutamine-hydrolysing)|nr:type 1 glutamine amidotransferase [Candidatus Methylacidiphilales bacterium]
MNLGVLQHAACEGPGEIAAWAAQHGHSVTVHHLYRGDPLPGLKDFDLLVVMGGEMNIYQYRDWPWLRAEREFIQSALAQGKRVAGICLGAQLIADALGSRVFQNAEHEMGWLPVAWTNEARAAFPGLPAASTVLHWHGDTFELPAGATRLAASEGCPEQGFFIPGKCLALQFHMEVDPPLVEQFVDSQGEWPSGRCVQTPKAILSEADSYCDGNRRLLHGILDRFCG